MPWEKEEREERAKRQAEADENIRRIRNVQRRSADKNDTEVFSFFAKVETKNQDPNRPTFLRILWLIVVLFLLYTSLAACSAVFNVLMGSR